MAISELTPMRPQQVTPAGTRSEGSPAHPVPKAAPKGQADTVEISDQARATFQKWQETREDGTETDVEQEFVETRDLLSAEELTSHAPDDSAVPPPSDPAEILPEEADLEPAKLYEEPEPTGADEARSLRVMGYSLSMIATKMNLDVETVRQYLRVV